MHSTQAVCDSQRPLSKIQYYGSLQTQVHASLHAPESVHTQSPQKVRGCPAASAKGKKLSGLHNTELDWPHNSSGSCRVKLPGGGAVSAHVAATGGKDTQRRTQLPMGLQKEAETAKGTAPHCSQRGMHCFNQWAAERSHTQPKTRPGACRNKKTQLPLSALEAGYGMPHAQAQQRCIRHLTSNPSQHAQPHMYTAAAATGLDAAA